MAWFETKYLEELLLDFDNPNTETYLDVDKIICYVEDILEARAEVKDLLRCLRELQRDVEI